MCVGWGAVVSPGAIVSVSNSMRQTLSSTLYRVWLWKQATVHRLMGSSSNSDGCEVQGTSCPSGGRGSQLLTPCSFLVAFSLFRPVIFTHWDSGLNVAWRRPVLAALVWSLVAAGGGGTKFRGSLASFLPSFTLQFSSLTFCKQFFNRQHFLSYITPLLVCCSSLQFLRKHECQGPGNRRRCVAEAQRFLV